MLLVQRRRIKSLEEAQDVVRGTLPMLLRLFLTRGRIHVSCRDLDASLKLLVVATNPVIDPSPVVVVEEAEKAREQRASLEHQCWPLKVTKIASAKSAALNRTAAQPQLVRLRNNSEPRRLMAFPVA
jgi:hypothetical protein